jgi:PAS domain S-box-containing protein
MSKTLQRQPMLWAALEASQDCVKLIGLDGKILYLNASGCRLMELSSPRDVVGKPWADLWPEASRALVEAALANGVAHRSDRFCAPCPTAQGHVKHWDVVVTPLANACGELEILLVTSRDVSDLQRARADAEEKRAALAKSAAALRGAGRVAKIAGFEISLATQDVDWSPELWEIIGATPRPIRLEEAMDIYPEAERPRILELLAHAASTGERITFTSEVTKFDGVKAPVRVFGEPVFENGVCVAICGAAQDITEAHEARRDLARAERRLRMAVGMAEILVYEIDYLERSVRWDGPAETFFECGLTYEHLWDDPFHSVDPRDREAAQEAPGTSPSAPAFHTAASIGWPAPTARRSGRFPPAAWSATKRDSRCALWAPCRTSRSASSPSRRCCSPAPWRTPQAPPRALSWRTSAMRSAHRSTASLAWLR